jgi:hypothetical protein
MVEAGGVGFSASLITRNLLISLNAKNYKNNTFAAMRYTAGTRDLMQRGVSSNWRKTSA